MNQLKAPNWKLAIGLPALVILTCILIVFTPIYQIKKSLLTPAILLDLLITAPLLYYFVIYNSTVPKKTVIRVFMIGLLFAGILVGTDSSKFLLQIKKWVAPILELYVVVSLYTNFSNAKKNAVKSGKEDFDFLPFCRLSLINFLGNKRLGTLIASEIAVFYYAFSINPSKPIDYKRYFSYHKKNGILLVLGTFLSLFIIETAGMHLVFQLWSKTAAWILTGISIYTCLQLFAHIRSIKSRPIYINDDTLELHNGLAGDASIPYTIIKEIDFTNKMPSAGTIQQLVLIKGFEGHNCVIHLTEPITINRLFGIEKVCDTILFNCDQPKLFEEEIKKMRT